MSSGDFPHQFIENELDKISRRGEIIGKTMKVIFKIIKKYLAVLWIILGLGLIVFLWSIIKGFREKK